MKKIIILIISYISIICLQAQSPTDLGGFLGVITDDTAAQNFDFSDYTAGTSSTEMQQILRDDGYSEDEINALTPTIDGISAGTITTLNDIDPAQYDAVIEVIAAKAADQFFSGLDAAELTRQINNLSNTLQILSSFGQANAQASRANPLFGYQGYELFAFSFGMTTSFATDDPNSIIRATQSDQEMKKLEERLENADISAGFAIQGFAANVGINMSRLVEDLYLGAIFGYTNINLDSEGLQVDPVSAPVVKSSSEMKDYGLAANMSSLTLGVTANYQIVKPVSVPILFRWNGLSLGTGIIFNSYSIGAQSDLSSFFPASDGSSIAPNTFVAKFDIDSKSITVPLEVSTGVKLLSIVNISAGAGLDLMFGGSNVSFNLEGPKDNSISSKLMVATLDEVLEKGNLAFPYDKDHSINFFNPRINAGVGFGIGPVTAVDFNFTYYIRSGFTFGVSFIFRV